jgi:chaperonin cofactor prefoldin
MPEREENIGDVRERLVRLEVKVEELNKRVENMQNYLKELYKYLQQTPSRTLI